MFIGIDLGTSAVKVVLVDENQQVIATQSEPLAVSRPAPGFSEQAPEDWWNATMSALDHLRDERPAAMAAVTGIGLSGQMHGATLLDAKGAVLRPCILWNDTRSTSECEELLKSFPDLPKVTGNQAMPGFTAPKILWVRHHEPEIFAKIDKVLLPKAYVRYRLTGEMIEDMSDASGTLWLDVGARDWSDAALAATGLTRKHMPILAEGSAPAGRLHADLATRFGMERRPLVAGSAGDNAAGAVGLGAIRPGDAFLSLGTSGVVWVTTDRFAPNPGAAVHAFCHALPGIWHQMGVTLSAAASLAWWSRVTGCPDRQLLEALAPQIKRPSEVTFLPYLSGERTPHNDGDIRGAFVGMSQDTSRETLTLAILEGVAFSFRDCLDALGQAGTHIERADVIGGGSRSRIWIQIMASVLGINLRHLADGEHGGAFGAARLARLAVTGEDAAAVCLPPHRLEEIRPEPALADAYQERLMRYRALYPAIKGAQK